jgi:Tol biopolymer transport system component
MKRWSASVVALVALTLPWSIASVLGKTENLPRLPGATFLLGYPPDTLMVTTADATLELQAEGGDWYITPSVSADGSVIASAHIPDSDSAVVRVRPLLSVGIYSMIEKRWRDYPNVRTPGGSVAISADGSKLACVTPFTAESPSRLQLLDLKTGIVSIGPESTKKTGSISWSPDGRHIAFSKEVDRLANGKPIPALMGIFVFDVETGTVSKIGDGRSPAWSPSGDWIAFYDYEPGRDDVKKGWYATNANRVSIIHPDGTGRKVLMAFDRDESLSVPPVWSPDMRTLLINRLRDEDKATMNIYLFDIATSKLRKVFGNSPPIYGWVAGKPS